MTDFSKIKTFPIKERKHKVKVENILPLDSEYKKLESSDFNELIEKIKESYKNNKMIIWMMGAHTIKTGQSSYIIELMKRGIIKHLATNGACSIHDFELAFHGETSEYVEQTISKGDWGMVQETGHYLNTAINQAAKNNEGYGYAVGKLIDNLNCKNRHLSIFWNAYKLNIPITTHVAIGTDTIHHHPEADGCAIGAATHTDFKLLTSSCSKLSDGIALNFGSAVIMPEAFSKALNTAINLGATITNLTTANFDFLDQYRPKVNIVQRPTMHNGKGYNILEKHEITIPNLYNKLKGEFK